MNIDPTTTKYLITARIVADGVIEKPDVVGAIFGQTEGLIGDELDLRDLQKSGRMGRIEVDLESKKGKSEGIISMPSSLDQVETAILKAMDVDIDRRFQRAQDFKGTLESPVSVQSPAVVEVRPYQGDPVSVVDDTFISTPPSPPSPEARPKKGRKSSRGNLFRIGFFLVVVLGIMTLGLGGLWTYFTYLKDTVTPTPSPTLVIPTDAPTSSVPPPTLTLTDIPTLIPTKPTPTWTPSPTMTETPLLPTPTDTPTKVLSEWYPCPGTYASRLHVGDQAHVSYDPPWNNNVRRNPNLSADRLGFLEPGEEMEVTDGPICADNMIWWRIHALDKNLAGWTSEGDSDNYWLVPLP